MSHNVDLDKQVEEERLRLAFKLGLLAGIVFGYAWRWSVGRKR